MPSIPLSPRRRRWIIWAIAGVLLAVAGAALLAERAVEPLLRRRLHTLIIAGSDSLYSYTLGDLDASFFGGTLSIQDLHIQIDSARYRALAADSALPSLTLEMDMGHAEVRGVQIFPLLFGKKVSIETLSSTDANVRLIRQPRREGNRPGNNDPLWKTLQPDISAIKIGAIRLENLRLLYRSADTALAMKLQFDTCQAYFSDIRIDSAAEEEPDRIGFARNIDLRFRDLKFRSADSTTKLKAEEIRYSSSEKLLEIVDFKMQPTLKEREDFYAAVGKQVSMTTIEFDRVRCTGFQLDRFVQENYLAGDSILVTNPAFDLYLDKTQPPTFESKMGKYPSQLLQKIEGGVHFKGIALRGARLRYGERGARTGMTGELSLDSLDLIISGATNDPAIIKKDPRLVLDMRGKILGGRLASRFTFFLDSTNGRFDAKGTITGVQAAQLNALSVPLANMQLQSLRIDELSFDLKGHEWEAGGTVGMRYRDLFVVVSKRDEETGVRSTQKFMTKILNKYTLQSANPSPGQPLRIATNVKRQRLTSQGFFGLLWGTIFTGMQQVMIQRGGFVE